MKNEEWSLRSEPLELGVANEECVLVQVIVIPHSSFFILHFSFFIPHSSFFI